MQTKIIGGGVGVPGIGQEMAVDPTFLAARVAIRPLEYQNQGSVYGHYKANLIFSNAAAITTTPLLTLRWAPSAPAWLVLTKFRLMGAALTTVFTTQQVVDIGATVARNFSAADTGGSSLLPAVSKSFAARTSMGGTLLQQLMAATAAISPGTRTLDSAPFCAAAMPTTSNTVATGGTPLTTSGPIDLYKYDSPAEHPVVLGNQEGIVFNVPNSMAAGGVVKWYIQLEWAEVGLF
jgi:hypothetical protein